MPADGGDIVGRARAESGPLLYRLAVMPIWELITYPAKQAIARIECDRLVETDIFQRAADQHVSITARYQIKAIFKENLPERRRIELEQQNLSAYRADVHVEGMFAEQRFAPRPCRNDVCAGNQPAPRGMQRNHAFSRDLEFLRFMMFKYRPAKHFDTSVQRLHQTRIAHLRDFRQQQRVALLPMQVISKIYMQQGKLMMLAPLRGEFRLIRGQQQHAAALVFGIDAGGGMQCGSNLTEHIHPAPGKARDCILIIPWA